MNTSEAQRRYLHTNLANIDRMTREELIQLLETIPGVVPVFLESQEEYEEIATKDPKTFYIIEEESGTDISYTIYLGEELIYSSGAPSEQEIFIAEYGVTPVTDIATAYHAGKVVYCKLLKANYPAGYDDSAPADAYVLVPLVGCHFPTSPVLWFSTGTDNGGKALTIAHIGSWTVQLGTLPYYTKPSAGIPASDLAQAVKDSLVFERGSGTNSVQQKGTGAVAVGEKSFAEGSGSVVTKSYTVSRIGNNDSKIYTSNSIHDLSVGDVISNKAGSIFMRITKVTDNRTFETDKSVAFSGESIKVYSGIAYGNSSHTEGQNTTAGDNYSHAEGDDTTASGKRSHAEGYKTEANATASHAEGRTTITGTVVGEHAEGNSNISIDGVTIHTVGIGSGSSARKNAHTITTDGKHYIPGIGTYQGTETTLPSGQDLATIVNNKQEKIIEFITLESTFNDVATIINRGNNPVLKVSTGGSALERLCFLGTYYANDYATFVEINDEDERIEIRKISPNGGWEYDGQYELTQIQANWAQSNANAVDYIKNKPTKVSAFTNDAGYLTQHQNISGKADKVSGATNNNFAALDANGNLKDSGHKHSDYLTSHQDISGKADKVSGATNNNFAKLDANGNLGDSGKKASDFQPTLISGTTIKTINNQSLLGSGNINVGSGTNTFIAEYNVTDYGSVFDAYDSGQQLACRLTDLGSYDIDDAADVSPELIIPFVGYSGNNDFFQFQLVTAAYKNAGSVSEVLIRIRLIMDNDGNWHRDIKEIMTIN